MKDILRVSSKAMDMVRDYTDHGLLLPCPDTDK